MIYHHEIIEGVLFISINGDLLGLPEEQKLIHLAESQMREHSITHCAIDISNAHYINSTGLTILIRILTLYRNAGGEVVLINPSPSVSKVLVITKLNAIFQVLKNKEEALVALSNKQLASA